MGERSIQFQSAVIVLLVVLAGIGMLIVIQNNDTQTKLEELRGLLQQQRNAPAVTPTAVALGAAQPSGTNLPTGLATAVVQEPVTHPGPDGVAEYDLAGLRVRAHEFENPAAVDGDSLTRSFGADAKGLNPYAFNEYLGTLLFGMCNDSLVSRDFDDPERWVPHLATDWTVEQTVRVHLLGKKPAAGSTVVSQVVAAWKADPACVRQWQAADITSITAAADGSETIEVKTDSVHNGYNAYLTTRLKDQIDPVQYVTVVLEPKFKRKEGQSPADLMAAVKDQLRLLSMIGDPQSRNSAPWVTLSERKISEYEYCFMGLGAGDQFKQRLTAALQAASPQYDPKDPTTLCGKVNPVETQPFEILPSFTFHLRHGVHWQSVEDPREGKDHAIIPGPEFTSADVLFTYEKVMPNPKVPCEHLRNYYKDLVSLSAPDAYTLRFDWARPYSQAFELSATFTCLPKHIFSQVDLDNIEATPFSRMVCGTGPWQFKRWTPNVELELDRNPDYWGVKPHLLKYTCKIVTEPPVILSLFQEGKLDQATLTPDQWRNNVDTPAMRKIAHKENGIANSYYYVGYNLRKGVFSDPRVRKALTMLIDRTAIIHTIFNDNAVPLTGPFHPLSPDNDASLPEIPYDPAGALKLLKEAGWADTDNDGVLDKDGVALEYNLMYRSGRPEHEQIAAFIQQADRKAGIKTNLVVLDWSAFIDRVNKQDFSACILGWQLGYTQDPYQLWHSSQTEPNMSNFVGYNDPVSDQLIVDGRYTLDPDARHAIYHQLHRRIYDAQPYTFLFVPKRMIVYSNRYEDVKYTLLDTDFNRYWVRPENQRKAP